MKINLKHILLYIFSFTLLLLVIGTKKVSAEIIEKNYDREFVIIRIDQSQNEGNEKYKNSRDKGKSHHCIKLA